MARENKSRYAVLGILTLGPMSGYEVRKTIEGSLSNFWSESYGQIYPILAALVEDGLATSETHVQSGRPNRTVYTITEAGRREMTRWLARPVEHSTGRIEILLKLFFGWQAPAEENRRKVEEYRDLHRGLLAKYEATEAWLRTAHAEHPGLPYWLMTLRYGQRNSRALLEWCEESMDALDGAPVTMAQEETS
jgi:DNA-binding PadR family transcriptional regulator